jgi:hypothetical protein
MKERRPLTLSNQQGLLLNLFHHSMKKEGKPRYPELETFRWQIEVEKTSPRYLLYSRLKKKVFTYKSVFLLFGFIFLSLSAVILAKASYWSFGTLSYKEFFIAKNLACTFCASIGVASGWIGYSLRPEKEAAGLLLRKAKHKLSKAFASQKLNNGLKGLLAFGKKYQQTIALQHAYQEAWDHCHHLHEELLHLFDRIGETCSLNEQAKEHLYNQALMEFKEKTFEVVHQFKDKRFIS